MRTVYASNSNALGQRLHSPIQVTCSESMSQSLPLDFDMYSLRIRVHRRLHRTRGHRDGVEIQIVSIREISPIIPEDGSGRHGGRASQGTI